MKKIEKDLRKISPKFSPPKNQNQQSSDKPVVEKKRENSKQRPKTSIPKQKTAKAPDMTKPDAPKRNTLM